MSQALYRKWRPHLWDEVIGQEHVIQTLKNAVRSDRIGHAYLFAGPRGTGKTTTARLIAKAVNCLNEDLSVRPCDQCENCIAVNEGRFLDLIEIDAASNTSVDDIRDLRDKINFAPSKGKYKVYIIDEVHMLSTAAFNALLKTLEEPPPHAIFVLATTEVHKIPPTVLSRCQRHEFRRIPVKDIISQLNNLSQKENIQIEEDALTLIARQSTGSLRDAISLLDQLAASGDTVTLATAQTILGTATNQLVIELINAIQIQNTADGLNCIHRALDSGTDPRQFARQIVDYLRSLLLINLGNAEAVDATAEMRSRMEAHASVFPSSELVRITNLFNNVASELRSAWQPGLSLELALTEAIEPQTAFQSARPAQKPLPPQPGLDKPITKRKPEQDLPATTKKGKTEPAGTIATPTSQKEDSVQEKPRPANTQEAVPDQVDAEKPVESQKANAINITLTDIKDHWREIRRLVRDQSIPTQTLLNSCKLLSLKNNILTLGFSTDILHSKMNTKENLTLTGRAVNHILNTQIEVRSVVMDTKAGKTPDNPDFDSDGIVGTALNLGGQIVDLE